MYFLRTFTKHEVARKLPMSFHPDLLRADLSQIEEKWWRRHLGQYHDGAWETVSLWSPGGNLYEQTSKGPAFGATLALRQCPYLEAVLSAFACEKNRVRLMRLKPGGRIFRHSDPIETISQKLLRVHIPIVTNENVRFLVNDLNIVMRSGEVWTVDVRFPHEVANEGEESRVHLVMDLLRNKKIDDMLENSSSVGCDYLTLYFMRQSLRRSVRLLSPTHR